MCNINITFKDNKKISVSKGTNLYEISKLANVPDNKVPILAWFNGKIYELNHKVYEDGNFEIVDPKRKISVLAYMRTLQFILIKSVRDLYPGVKVRIEHSLSKGIFGEVNKETPLTQEDVKNIKNRMQEIIDKDIVIHKLSVPKEKAIEIFKEYDMDAKLRMFAHVDNKNVTDRKSVV